MNDNEGKMCSECLEGTYTETSIYDDWDGVLHCNKCEHGVKRYERKYDDEIK